MAKKTILIIFLLISVFSLKITQSSHKKSTSNHQNKLQDIGQGIGAFADLVQAFQITCESGYLRSTHINVRNYLPGCQNGGLTFQGKYQDSGWSRQINNPSPKCTKSVNAAAQPGWRKPPGVPPSVRIDTTSPYVYSYSDSVFTGTKTGGTATGINGVVVYNVQNRAKLVIFYENPWSSWPFGAVCIDSSNSVTAGSSLYRTIYNRFWSVYSSQPKSNSLNSFIDSPSSTLKCGYIENVYNRQPNGAGTSGSKSLQFSFGEYSASLGFEYKGQNSSSNVCYLIKMNVAIKR